MVKKKLKVKSKSQKALSSLSDGFNNEVMEHLEKRFASHGLYSEWGSDYCIVQYPFFLSISPIARIYTVVIVLRNDGVEVASNNGKREVILFKFDDPDVFNKVVKETLFKLKGPIVNNQEIEMS